MKYKNEKKNDCLNCNLGRTMRRKLLMNSLGAEVEKIIYISFALIFVLFSFIVFFVCVFSKSRSQP